MYLQARTHYGIVDPTALDALRHVWRQILGEQDLDALDELFSKLIWIPDGELDALDRAAREYRAIIGAPDPPPSEDRDDSDQRRSADPAGPAISPRRARWAKRSNRRWTRRAGDNSSSSTRTSTYNRCSRTRQPDPGRGSTSRSGRGTGMPTGRMPDRGVDRPPAPDEVQHARRYATRLRQALTHGTRQIDKRTPGGRFDGRAYARGKAQRQTGRPASTHPWRITRQVTAPIQEPHVGLVIDTSGSMGAYEYALGPICWILTDGLRQIGGRCATALFGNSVALLADGTRPLPLVPGIKTGGGTAFAGDAIELLCEHLEMTNPRRPRFVYVLSDGGWADTQAGVERIRWLAEHDVPTIHLAIGIAPLSVECDRIHVITDPAQALDQIAADTVAALRARVRARPTTPST